MTSATLSSTNTHFSKLLITLSQAPNSLVEIPEQATFYQLVLTPFGRQQVTEYIDLLCRHAQLSEGAYRDKLDIYLLPAINALITCNIDNFPAVYRALSATGLTEELHLTVQKALLYWAGDPDSWHHLLLIASQNKHVITPRIRAIISKQFSIGDHSNYWSTTRDEYSEKVHMPRFLHAVITKQLLGTGDRYLAQCQSYETLPTRKARLTKLKQDAAQCIQELQAIKGQIEACSDTTALAFEFLQDLNIVIALFIPKPVNPDEETLIRWQARNKSMQLKCINVAIAMMKDAQFATSLLKENLMLRTSCNALAPVADINNTLNEDYQSKLPKQFNDQDIAQLVQQTERSYPSDMLAAEIAEREWVILQAQTLFEADDSHLKTGSTWLSPAVQFFDSCRGEFSELRFYQVVEIVLEQAKSYFNNSAFLAYSDNEHWQRCFSKMQWQTKPANVLGYGVFGANTGDIIHNPTRQKKNIKVNENDYLGISYRLANPDDYPEDKLAVTNRIEVYSESGALLFSDQWPDQMQANVVNFVLYIMEQAESYPGFWCFSSFYQDQCLLQQRFYVDPAAPCLVNGK